MSSILTLQFGQCGNQIGQSLYQLVQEDLKKETGKSSTYINRWFHVNDKEVWEPRSILVDTETKVVANIKLPFKFTNIVTKSIGGCGNNWACGYSETSPLVIDDVLNLVHKELEKSDFLTCILNLYSLAGGTGSGVGSAVIEMLRGEFPKKTIVNCAVLPYTKGEVSTQSYNCVLSLSKLYDVADATILFENERLLHICKYSLGLNDVSNANLNQLVSQQLISSLKPTEDGDVISLINNLVHPRFKLLQIRSEPNGEKKNSKFECGLQWSMLVNSLSKQSRFDTQYNSVQGLNRKLISSALISHDSEKLPVNIVNMFRGVKGLVSWLPPEECVKVYQVKTPFLSYSKYLSQIINSNSIVSPLNEIVEDAWKSFCHEAYLHHYQKYGIDCDYFLNSFQVLENILNNYTNI